MIKKKTKELKPTCVMISPRVQIQFLCDADERINWSKDKAFFSMLWVMGENTFTIEDALKVSNPH